MKQNKMNRMEMLIADQRGTNNKYDGKCDHCKNIRTVQVHWGLGEGLILCEDCLEIRNIKEAKFYTSFEDKDQKKEINDQKT